MKKSYGFIISAAVLWGCIGINVRGLSSLGFSQIQIVFIRSLAALASIIPVIIIKDSKFFEIKLRDIWCFTGTGILSLLMFNVCYFYTMELTSLGAAAVLLYTAPAFVAVFSAFLFKEKLTVFKIIALIMILCGCTFVSGIIGSNYKNFNILGTVTGLASGVGYALYSIFSRYALNRGYNTYTISFYTFLFSTLGCIPFGNIGFIFGNFSLKACVYAVIIGFFCCTLPYLLYTHGLSGVSNTTASMLSTIEPVVAACIGVFVFHEEMSVYNIAGIFPILCGIAVMNINPFKNKKA